MNEESQQFVLKPLIDPKTESVLKQLIQKYSSISGFNQSGTQAITANTSIMTGTFTKGSKDMMVLITGEMDDTGVNAWYAGNQLNFLIDTVSYKTVNFVMYPQAAAADQKTITMVAVINSTITTGTHTFDLQATRANANQTLVASKFSIITY